LLNRSPFRSEITPDNLQSQLPSKSCVNEFLILSASVGRAPCALHRLFFK
jgi:hypothetical protein